MFITHYDAILRLNFEPKTIYQYVIPKILIQYETLAKNYTAISSSEKVIEDGNS